MPHIRINKKEVLPLNTDAVPSDVNIESSTADHLRPNVRSSRQLDALLERLEVLDIDIADYVVETNDQNRLSPIETSSMADNVKAAAWIKIALHDISATLIAISLQSQQERSE